MFVWMGPKLNAPRPTRIRSLRNRIAIRIPVKVSWKTADGGVHDESAQVEELGASGGVIQTKQIPPKQADLLVVHSSTNQPVLAWVVRIVSVELDGTARVAIRFKKPQSTLWGIMFPPPTARA